MTSPPRVSTLLIAGAITLFGLTAVTVAQAAPAPREAPASTCQAHDHTSGTPGTTVKHPNRLDRRTMHQGSGLDAAQDAIGCDAA